MLTSPISVKFLLTILAEGAGDDVESEMRNQLRTVLPYSKTLNDSRAYYKKVLASMGVRLFNLNQELNPKNSYFRLKATATK